MASYNLNLIPGDAPVVVPVNQYDYGYSIDFTVYDGDTVFSLSGYTAVINIGKADRNVYVGGTVTLRGNTATIMLEEQMTAAYGPCIAEIVFTNANGRRATANFILDVEKSPLEDGAESESVINYIDASIEAAESATEAATQAAEAAIHAGYAATDARNRAAELARNIEAMPQTLQTLAATLAQSQSPKSFLGYDKVGNAGGYDIGIVTPEMYGAAGDGVEDDFLPVFLTLGNDDGKHKVVIPPRAYNLNQNTLYSDDSIVIADYGEYRNYARIAISKNIRESAPIERTVTQFNASDGNIRDYSLRGACYDSVNERIIIAYGTSYSDVDYDTDLVLTAYDTDFNPISGMSAVITGAGQGMGLVYSATSHEIEIACGNGTHPLSVAVVDADTLTFDRWEAVSCAGDRILNIMRDYDTHYRDYVTYETEDGLMIAPTVTATTNSFLVNLDEIREIASIPAGETLTVESAIVYKGQILQLISGSGAAYLVQFNYAYRDESDAAIKKVYRLPSHYMGGDEPKSLVDVNGTIYLLTDVGRTAGQMYVGVSQIILDGRIAGDQSIYEDAKTLGAAPLSLDLNEILAPGLYVSPSVTVSNSLTNVPTSQAFIMWVVPIPVTKESRAQILMTYHGDIFVRSYVAHVSIWYGWRQLAETPRKGATKTGLWDGVGYVTSGGTEVRFTIPHPMPTASDSMPSVTVTSCKVNIRQNENYLVQNSTDLVSASGYVVSATASPFGIRVTIVKSSAFPNAVNNSPCGVSANITLRFN